MLSFQTVSFRRGVILGKWPVSDRVCKLAEEPLGRTPYNEAVFVLSDGLLANAVS